MPTDSTKGYADKDQKAAQLAALKVEHENHLRFGRPDRAKEVAAYAKEHHGVSLTTPRAAKTEE